MNFPSSEWLPLLRRLTEVSPSWGVWKNADRAMSGLGDVDSVVSVDEKPRVVREFNRWAGKGQFQWIIECDHAGGILVLIATSHDQRWAQLDLVHETPFRGARLFRAEELQPMMVVDSRGFRRVREGAEGVFLFLYKSILRAGRPHASNLRKYDVLEKISRDWKGATAAAALLGPAMNPLLQGIGAALEGDWDRTSLIEVEALTVLRAFTQPRFLVSRLMARGWRLRRCEVAAAIAAGRCPSPLNSWLQRVDRTHVVQPVEASR